MNCKRAIKKRIIHKFKCVLCFLSFPSKFTYELHLQKSHCKRTRRKIFAIKKISESGFEEMRFNESLEVKQETNFSEITIKEEYNHLEFNNPLSHNKYDEFEIKFNKNRKNVERGLYDNFFKSKCNMKHVKFRNNHKDKNYFSHICTKQKKAFCCQICDKIYTTKDALLDHNLRIHNNAKEEFWCAQCNKKFFTKRRLKAHIYIHNRVPTHKCTTCSKVFKTARHLQCHILSVHANPDTYKYVCKVCSIKYPVRYDLNKHMSIHIKEKPYNCQYCNELYDSFSTCVYHMLKEHQDIHICNFRCEYCGKTFSRRDRFKIHLETHTGYSCNFCSDKFNTKASLKAHALLVHGDNGTEHKCPECTKLFKSSSDVKKHVVVVHTDPKDYKFCCKHCQKRLPFHYQLQRHIKEKHQTND